MTKTKTSKPSPQNRIALALDRVSTEPTPKGCLLWEGATIVNGYGQVSFGGKMVKTHRLAFAFGLNGERHGALPPPEVVIRHSCDTPRCNNPEHLQAGSVADNNRDRDERGRAALGDAHYARRRPERMARGEAHSRSKLSDADVATIHLLRAEGLLQREIGVLVGCSQCSGLSV
jgi:hypothetical protein